LPSRISSCIVGSSPSSCTFFFVDFTFWMYYVQNPKSFSIAYPIAMLLFSWAIFLTYPLKVFMYLSVGYIHDVWFGPQRSSSSTRWITRWVITSKLARGKTFSKVNMVSAVSSMITYMVMRSMALAQSLLKTLLKLIKAFRISEGITFWRQRGNICCMIIW